MMVNLLLFHLDTTRRRYLIEPFGGRRCCVDTGQGRNINPQAAVATFVGLSPSSSVFLLPSSAVQAEALIIIIVRYYFAEIEEDRTLVPIKSVRR